MSPRARETSGAAPRAEAPGAARPPHASEENEPMRTEGHSEHPAHARRAILALALALGPAGALAQARFPERPIRVIVPFGPGSSPDIVARVWGERLAAALGQPVVVENRAGASTIVGAQAAAQARPDGHTLLYGVNNTFSINPFIYWTLPYRAEDFTPVVRMLSVPYALAVPAGSPHRSLADLVAAARARPGALSYGSYGVGQGTHVAMAWLLNAAGAGMVHVPYRESPVNDLLAGRIDVLVDATTTAIPMAAEGRIRVLAVTGPARLDALPDVPTVTETARATSATPGRACSSGAARRGPRWTS